MKKIKKTINGVEYHAVWKGVKFNEIALKECAIEGSDKLSQKKLADIIFSEIIVYPKIGINDFDDMYEFLQVYEFGKSVLNGTFEKRMSKSQLKEKVMEDWACWRLVFCDMANFTYDEVFNHMTPTQITEANVALDIVNAELKSKIKKH